MRARGGGDLARPDSPKRDRPAAPRGRLAIPLVLTFLTLGAMLGAIVLGQLYRNDLRSSMARMDRSLEGARERQQELARHFAEAQDLLLAQQRHLQEVESGLRAREAALAAERAALEADRERLARAGSAKRLTERLVQARHLALGLDAALAELGRPGGIERAAAVLNAIGDWLVPSDDAPAGKSGATARPGPEADPVFQSALEADAAVHDALAAAREALTASRAQTPAGRLQALSVLMGEVERLSPGLAMAPALRGGAPTGYLPPPPFAGAGAQVAGQLKVARLAIQRGDEPMVRLALDTATVWLAAYFDGARPEVAAIQARLDELRRQSATPERSAPEAALASALARLRAAIGELIERVQQGDTPVPAA